MSLHLVPVFRDEARRFVGEHHRHNLPPLGAVFYVGVAQHGELVGVAIAGRPSARALQDGITLEIVRVCTDGAPNACSMLYGACCRAAAALGYARCITYTLQAESGSSLRAAGFKIDAELAARDACTPGASRQRDQQDLFGVDRRPPGPKYRWTKELAA